MSDKLFNFLSNYYTLSKKYFPLVLLAIVFALSFAIKNFALMLVIYAIVSVLHLVVLLVLRHFIQKELLKSIDLKDIEEMGANNENE